MKGQKDRRRTDEKSEKPREKEKETERKNENVKTYQDKERKDILIWKN